MLAGALLLAAAGALLLYAGDAAGALLLYAGDAAGALLLAAAGALLLAAAGALLLAAAGALLLAEVEELPALTPLAPNCWLMCVLNFGGQATALYLSRLGFPVFHPPANTSLAVHTIDRGHMITLRKQLAA